MAPKLSNAAMALDALGRYIADQQLSGNKTVRIQTKNRVMEIHSNSKNMVTANMGAPSFIPGDIPLLSDQQNDLVQH
jgi:diaminopimelate epimerase